MNHQYMAIPEQFLHSYSLELQNKVISKGLTLKKYDNKTAKKISRVKLNMSQSYWSKASGLSELDGYLFSPYTC
jgi:hypothetical protein